MNSRCFKFYRAYFISFNSSNGRHFFLELNTKRLYQSCGKEKESSCLMLTSSTKRKISHFHVVVVYRQQRNVQKRVMHVQSCCFANLNLLLFCRSHCCRHRCLSSLIPNDATLLVILVTDGGYSEWCPFTSCSVSCGGGVRYRNRTCTNPPPQNGGMDCQHLGPTRESQKCNTQSCSKFRIVRVAPDLISVHNSP